VWYERTAEQALAVLQSQPQTGLNEAEAASRIAQYGPNSLTPPQSRGPLLRFLQQFHQPLVYLLLAAAAITALLSEWIDSGVILGVVLMNALIGFIQESKALEAIDALARSMTTEATVLRDGVKRLINASALVPGDIVFLQAGDKVPADLRLVRVRDLQVDESALTGESLPVSKHAAPLPTETVLADRRNMAFSSALVTYGAATGLVVATGDRTEIGRISELLETTQSLATPLTRKIAHFSHILLYVILAMAAVTFMVGILRGEGWVEMFMAAVALAVGAIPEGLPAAMTITLAIGVSRMARRNAIIRKLPAVETLGSTTLICSDKTGTLTQNQMTVHAAFAGGGEYVVTGSGYLPKGAFESVEGPPPEDNTALHQCLLAGLLCNEARLLNTADGWSVEGDPTEGALLSAASKFGLGPDAQAALPRIDAIPFESEHQYMATLHQSPLESAPPVSYVKGAAEVLVTRCQNALDACGSLVPLDAEAIRQQVEAMASRGLRVLLFAREIHPIGQNSIDHTDVAEGLTFLGLQGMIDPPRQEAVAAVAACQHAGIRVKMITGDHAGTASAIASQIGLRSAGPAALTGAQLSAIPDADLPAIADDCAVFARVTPEQKLRLVTALQTRGHVVAMTGDGVNDAPALRRADIGIAMGITGTEVAKEAADMILTDDNFASIEAAVEEGRSVFDNLVKFISWTLPTNIGEGLVILAAVFVGAELPILPVQLLWINMTTAVFLGLTLAMEPKEPGIMDRQPRDPSTPILTRTLQFRIGLVSALLLAAAFGFFEWALFTGGSLAEARTMAVNVFVFGELFYLFNCRSLTKSMLAIGLFSNPWLIGGVSLMIALQLLFTYAPFMHVAFHSAPMRPIEWVFVIAASITIWMVVGLEKWLRRRGSSPTPQSA
jgi:Ca2+-transporting ATPase